MAEPRAIAESGRVAAELVQMALRSSRELDAGDVAAARAAARS